MMQNIVKCICLYLFVIMKQLTCKNVHSGNGIYFFCLRFDCTDICSSFFHSCFYLKDISSPVYYSVFDDGSVRCCPLARHFPNISVSGTNYLFFSNNIVDFGFWFVEELQIIYLQLKWMAWLFCNFIYE